MAETITIKFFEVGHTFMSADSLHHLVEKGLRENPKVYDFQDFSAVVQNSSKKNTIFVKEMEFKDFRYWPSLTTNYQLNKLNKDRPFLKEIVLVQARRGSRLLYFKTEFDADYGELNILPKKCALLKEPKSHERNRGIAAERKRKILANLGDIIPKHKLHFWENLHENNVPDLITNIEDD